VAGGLAGAYWGLEGVPADWLSTMRGREIVDPLVVRLVAAAAAKEQT
jgi:ADP-ribosylglycohydrolase